MQAFYKLFVSEKEVINKLPVFLKPKMSEEKIIRFINNLRKILFFKKLRKFMLKHVI
jgi:hypothetical protein